MCDEVHAATEFRAKVQHTRNHHARTRSKEGVDLKCQFNRGLSLYTAGLVEVWARESARARERERVSHLEDFQDLRTRSRLMDMCNNKCSFSSCRCSATCWPTSQAERCTREEVSDKQENKVEEEQRSRRTKDV